ncbi:MAG: hypothetical protein ACFFKA_06875 [Candidatus Thorarchaeota archaeon]
MSEDQLKIIDYDQKACKIELARKYIIFLSKYPEIFSDLDSGFRFDFAIYNSIEDYDAGSPLDVFYVYGNGHNIELKPGRATSSDLELALSVQAVEKLIQTKDKIEYTHLLGSFYNEPDEQKGWIDFILHKRTQAVIDMGYGRFAQTAGILKDDE